MTAHYDTGFWPVEPRRSPLEGWEGEWEGMGLDLAGRPVQGSTEGEEGVLALQVLLEAVFDFFTPGPDTGVCGQRDAGRFLFSDEEGWKETRTFWCEQAGIDSEWFGERLMEGVEHRGFS